MNEPSNYRNLLSDIALTTFILTFVFVWGTTYVQGFENYPYWRDLGPHISSEAFRELREAHYWKIYPLAVYPGLVTFLANVILLFVPPPKVSRWIIPTCFVLGCVVGYSTFTTLIPIQDQLDAMGYNRELLEQLILNDFYFRKIPGSIAGLLVVVLVWQITRRASR